MLEPLPQVQPVVDTCGSDQFTTGFQALAKEVQAYAVDGVRPGVVLLGDFNATPDSELYELLSTKQVCDERYCAESLRSLSSTYHDS